MLHLSAGARDVARCWAGFASLGAGLVLAALVLQAAREGWVAGVLTGALAGTQVVTGLVLLGASRVPAPWALTALAASGVVVALALPGTATAGLALIALEVALAWLVGSSRAAAGVAPGEPLTEVPHPWRRLGVLAAGALVVAGTVTPALAATDAGQDARPHGHTADAPPAHGH